MISEPIDKYSGTPMSAWIKKRTKDLEIDPVSLWHIIETGRDNFSLEGSPLIEYVQRSVFTLLHYGAVPVIGAVGYKDRDWLPQEGYGNTLEEITVAVIDEWLKSGKDPDIGGLWFALPEML